MQRFLGSMVACSLGFFLALPALAQQLPAPPPQVVTLQTRDGVQLAITYYPGREPKGSDRARQTTPVVMLHDLQDTRAVFGALAQRLQSFTDSSAEGDGAAEGPSFAVVAVDLRGHGDSTRQVAPDGSYQELDPARLGRGDLLAMVANDMEQVRSFLVGKNDAGELNLNKLCMIGAGMGATVAVNWAAHDWSAPPLAIGKQGQDVKGLVLISPRWSYQGVALQEAMRFGPLKQNVAWMIIYGSEDSRAQSDARRIYRQLERFHPEGPAGAEHERRLVSLGWPSSLQGGRMLGQMGAAIEEEIVAFLTTHIATQDLPWTARRPRLP